jgi:D-alanine-D-alanine ligase
MLVGLTYDLRADYLAMGYGEEETAEFDRPDTVEAIERELVALGHRTDRIGHIRHLVERLASGARFDLVFNIAEGMHGFGREAQVPALLDAYAIPYTFADPLCAAVTLHKAAAKRILRDAGIPTPPFALVERPEDAARVDLPFPLFVKPVAEGTAKGIHARSKVADRAALAEECARVIATCRQPALVETFLPGREVTVGITGTGDRAVAIGTLEVVLKPQAEADSYTYKNKEYCEELCEYKLAKGPFAEEAERLALEAWRGLGCRDGGRIDLRADGKGRLSVLEANPLPGLHPEHSDLPILCTAVGIPYRELIRRIVASATERVSAA